MPLNAVRKRKQECRLFIDSLSSSSEIVECLGPRRILSLSLSPPPLSKQGRLYVILHERSESSELCCWLHDTLACSRIMFKVLSFCDWFLQRRSFYRLVFVGERVHEQVMIVEYGWVHPAISFICECFWFVIFKSNKLYVYISTVRNKYQLARWHIVVLARSLHLNLQLCCDIIV